MNNKKWERRTRKNRTIAIAFTVLLHLGIIGGVYYMSNPDAFLAKEAIETVESAEVKQP